MGKNSVLVTTHDSFTLTYNVCVYVCVCKLHTKIWYYTLFDYNRWQERETCDYLQVNTSDNANVDEGTEQYRIKTNKHLLSITIKRILKRKQTDQTLPNKASCTQDESQLVTKYLKSPLYISNHIIYFYFQSFPKTHLHRHCTIRNCLHVVSLNSKISILT